LVLDENDALLCLISLCTFCLEDTGSSSEEEEEEGVGCTTVLPPLPPMPFRLPLGAGVLSALLTRFLAGCLFGFGFDGCFPSASFLAMSLRFVAQNLLSSIEEI